MVRLRFVLVGSSCGGSCSSQVRVLIGCLCPQQDGRRGHNSVEDAQAALDLYKLVEDEWEWEVQTALSCGDAPEGPSSSSHYMQDQYWPSEVVFRAQ